MESGRLNSTFRTTFGELDSPDHCIETASLRILFLETLARLRQKCLLDLYDRVHRIEAPGSLTSGSSLDPKYCRALKSEVESWCSDWNLNAHWIAETAMLNAKRWAIVDAYLSEGGVEEAPLELVQFYKEIEPGRIGFTVFSFRLPRGDEFVLNRANYLKRKFDAVKPRFTGFSHPAFRGDVSSQTASIQDICKILGIDETRISPKLQPPGCDDIPFYEPLRQTRAEYLDLAEKILRVQLALSMRNSGYAKHLGLDRKLEEFVKESMTKLEDYCKQIERECEERGWLKRPKERRSLLTHLEWTIQFQVPEIMGANPLSYSKIAEQAEGFLGADAVQRAVEQILKALSIEKRFVPRGRPRCAKQS